MLRGGENISVSEVEELLFEHPMVERDRDRGDARSGDGGAGLRVRRADRAGHAHPRRPDPFLGASTSVAKQKYPERVELLPDLPKTQSGKVQKYLLRQKIRDIIGDR